MMKYLCIVADEEQNKYNYEADGIPLTCTRGKL